MPIRAAVAIFVSVALTHGARAGVNVLENPGFETGVLDPWFQDRSFGGGLDEDYFIDTFEPRSGQFSAGIFANKELRQNFDPVPVENIEEISFWARHRESTDVADIFVALFYESTPDSTVLVRTAGPGWNFFDVTGELATGRGGLVGISVFGNSGFRFNFDDATVSVVPAPATAALAGAACLALARRRRG